MKRQIWLTVLILSFLLLAAAGEPCTDYVLVEGQFERSVNFNDPTNTVSLCDRRIDEAWYRFSSGAGNDMVNYAPEWGTTCGTGSPVWLKGDLPAANQQIDAIACVNYGPFGDCFTQLAIKIKNCGDFNVYWLIPTPDCPTAYCFGTETQCPAGQVSETGFTPCIDDPFATDPITATPAIEWGIGDELFNNIRFKKLKFECNIDTPQRDNLLFNVQWYFDELLVHEQTVDQNGGLPAIINEADWREKTSLGKNVKCVMKPHIGGAFGDFLESPSVFAGFEITEPVNGEILEIKEGQKKTIQIRPTVPVICPTQRPCTVELDLKVPDFQTRLDTCGNGLKAADLVLEQTDCGIKVSGVSVMDNNHLSADWRVDTLINVQATQDGQYDGDQIGLVHLQTASSIFMPGWNDYALPDVRIRVLDGDVSVAGKKCYSHNDPHMNTFDGRQYEMQKEGEFILYRHSTLPVEVHTYYKRCGGATCNCGVAVRAGTDVYIIDSCYKGTGIHLEQALPGTRIGMIGCDDQGMRIESRNNGRYYTIHLPTGGKVNVDLYSGQGNFFNVDMTPSVLDIENSGGLCGYLDSDNTNDFKGRDDTIYAVETYPYGFAETWRVPADESLYNGGNKALMTFYSRHVYCNCPVENVKPGHGLTPEALCGFSKEVQVCIKAANDITARERLKCERKKRSVGHDFVEDDVVYSFDYDPNFNQQVPEWQAPWTDESAREYCEQFIVGSPSGSACLSAVPNVNANAAVENCIQDIKLSGDTDFSIDHLEGLKSSCMEEIGRNISLWTVPNNSTGVAVPLPDVANVFASSCPNECSFSGDCVNGTCYCYYEELLGDDCSINITIPPVVFSIPQLGLCDLSTRPCEQTPIYGDFISLPNITCKIAQFTIRGSQHEVLNEVNYVTAEFHSLGELYCPLPKHIRSVSSSVEANGYYVSASYDGNHYSDELVLVAYDATCEICNTTSLECTLKNNSCHIDGVCYAPGDRHTLNNCQVCDPINSNTTWTHMDVCQTGDGTYYTVPGYPGWKGIFKATSGIGGDTVYNLWKNNGKLDLADLDDLNTESQHYKSEMVDKWQTLGIKKVLLVVAKNGQEQKRFEFNGHNTDKMNWFQGSRLLQSPYSDLTSSSSPPSGGNSGSIFSIEGAERFSHGRHFFINANYGGCGGDNGWFVVSELSTGPCAWEKPSTEAPPRFIYSPGNGQINWHTGTPGFADVLAIFIQN